MLFIIYYLYDILFIIYICNINTNSFVKYECINEYKYEYIYIKSCKQIKTCKFCILWGNLDIGELSI